LNAINTKILIAVLATLGAIGALLIHQHSKSEKAAAAILEQQKADADQHNREEEEFRKKVAAEERKNNVNPGNESKTWKSYVP
jgi:hypothetical protein